MFRVIHLLDLNQNWSRFCSFLKLSSSNYFGTRLPGVACEITENFISVVQFDHRNSKAVDKFAIRSIPKGLLDPSLTKLNVSSVQDLARVVRATLDEAGIKTSRISLAIPDASVRVAILSLDKLPSKYDEKIEFFKWKLKKSVPYNIEESHLNFLEQDTDTGQNVVITVNIYREVLEQFEEVFENLEINLGLIVPSTFAAYELLVRQDRSDIQNSVLFVRTESSSMSSLITQGGVIVFYQHKGSSFNKPFFSGTENSDQIPNQLIDPYEDIHPYLMYYQDKLESTGVKKVVLMYPNDFDESQLLSLEERSKALVSNFDPSTLFHWKHDTPFNKLKIELSPALGLALGKL